MDGAWWEQRATLLVACQYERSMTGDALLAFGLVMSTASQLRIWGSPIGPGEILLLLWLLVMLGREIVRLGPPLTPPLFRLLVFWVVFAVAESLGTLTAVFIGDRHDTHWFLHDVMAYPLIAAVSCQSVVEPEAKHRLNHVAWWLVSAGTFALAVQLADAAGLITMPMVDPWYWDRLRGWSANPNQLALLCAALVLISLHLAETASRGRARAKAIGCSVLPVVAGRLTGSDTFTLMIAVAIPVFAGFKIWAWVRAPGRRLTLRMGVAWSSLLAMPFLLASLLPIAWLRSAEPEQFAMSLAKDSGKAVGAEADLRLHLWQEAISRGTDAWMLGLGPGPHLDVPATLVAARVEMANQPGNIVHPEEGAAPNFEAHNTVLDLFVQGGVMADLAFAWLIATALRGAHRALRAGLSTAVCGLVLFGMNNLIIRQPIFWFVIALCLVEGSPRPQPSVLAARGGSLTPISA